MRFSSLLKGPSPGGRRAAAFFCLLLLIFAVGCGGEPAGDASGAKSPSLFTLRYAAAEGGRLEGETVQTLTEGESGTAVTAVPDPGYGFVRWSDGLTAPSRTDGADASSGVVTALFERRYRLSFAVSPAGAGSIEGHSGGDEFFSAGENTDVLRAVPAAGYRFAGWSDGVSEETHPAVSVEGDLALTAYFTEIPSVSTLYITTEGEKKITSKKEYLSAAVRVDASIENYKTGELACRIRGHGNSSWDNFRTTKPSYRLKLEEKRSLLGIGSSPGKDYVLLSNHSDATMLRNYTVLSFGKLLENISYVPSSKFVQLYLNGEYRGLYQLCEKIKTGGGRVEIGDKSSGGETDIGYLLELDKRAPEEKEKDNVFFLVDGLPIAVKSDGRSEAQLAFIKEYMTRFHNAVKAGDREAVDALADIPSIIDMFLLEEFSKERDAGFASFYLIKEPGGKLRFSCPWDFDLSLGNDSMFRYPKGLVTESDRANPWFAALLRQDWFRAEVGERLREIAPRFDTLITDITAMGELLRDPAALDDKRWSIYGRRLLWEPDMVCFALHNYDEHLSYLLTWMRDRADWLIRKFDAA